MNGLFHLLPLAVLLRESLGQGAGAGGVFGQQQFEGLLGAREPPRGIDARAELEPDVRRGERRRDARRLDERTQAGPARFFQLQKPALNEDAILALERDDVGHGAERDDDRGNRANRPRGRDAS